MFNWTSLPALLAMLLFWMLACYVLTRVGRGPTAWTLVAFQVGAAAYFLSQAMRANAPTLGDWLFWARGLYWTSPITAVLWYRLSVLLLRDLPLSEAHPALLRAVSALGLLVTISAAALVVAIYGSDLVFVWSAAGVPPPERAPYYRFDVSTGPLYPLGAAHYLVCLLGAIVNAALGRLLARDSLERHHFGRLLLAGGLFFLGINSLVLYRLLFEGWAIWPSNVVVTLGVVVIALDTTAYCLHLEKKVMGRDLLSFLVALGTLCLLYALLVASVTRGYSFQTLELLVSLLLAIILSHALIDVARRGFDRIFLPPEARATRDELLDRAQDAAMVDDLEPVLQETRAGLDAVSARLLVGPTEEALRRLDTPTALADCGLIGHLPATLSAARAEGRSPPGTAPPTPLEEAHLLREVLIRAIEHLKPPDLDPQGGPGGGLQYQILREQYLLGRPTKQIIARHSIGEGTFNRTRRAAIAGLARELNSQERQLARPDAPRPTVAAV